MKKILILSVFPAPYRVNLFNGIVSKYSADIFFERNTDSGRSKEWFAKNASFDCKILTDTESNNQFENKIKNIKDYDLVLAYEYSTKLSLKLMFKCIVNKVPYAINCDGAFTNNDFLKTRIKRFFIKRASVCFANGQHAKEYFLFYGADEKRIYLHNFTSLYKKNILENVLSSEEKAQLKLKENIENKKTVISVGQFIHRKGYDVLLKSWSQVKSDCNLLIIGGGEKENEYKEYIKENNLKNVTIMGFVPFDKLLEYLKACELFVLPTREDIWGLVINEAMACGLPVITTDSCIAGLELVQDDVNGYIFKSEDSEQLATSIDNIISDDKLMHSMAENSLKKIQPYTYENLITDHLNVIEKVIK